MFAFTIPFPIHFHGWFNGAVSLLVCITLLYVICRLATRWKLYDPPGDLKIHTAPISRLGGVAIGAALLAGISIGGPELFAQALDFYLAIVLIWATGLIDDLRDLPPEMRLLSQVTAGLLIAQTQWGLALFQSHLLNAAATALFVVLFVNAFNFLDGADGLAGGAAAMVSLGYILLYTAQAASVGAAVAWSLFGACIGFLLLNFPPAKIFMGDSGSTTLGLLIAFLGLDFYRVHHSIGTHLLLPLVFAGIPLLDLLLAVVRRLRKRASPFAGDRQHFYDLLRQQGWSPRPVALGSYLATGALILVGWLCNQSNWMFALAALTITFGYLLFAAVRLGSLR